MAVGPLHGTHQPPFYVYGSDQWWPGYMESAVRTGRAAAAAASAAHRRNHSRTRRKGSTLKGELTSRARLQPRARHQPKRDRAEARSPSA